MSTDLKTLSEIIKFVMKDRTPSNLSKETAKALALLIKSFNELKKDIDKRVGEIADDLGHAYNTTTDIDKKISSVSSQSKKMVDDSTKTILDIISQIELRKGDKGDPGEKGEPGTTKVVYTMDESSVAYLEDMIETIRSEMPGEMECLSADEIRDELESLEGDDRIDKTAIKGLKEEIDRLDKQIKEKNKSGGITVWGGTGLKKVIHDDTLTGDGTLKSPLSATLKITVSEIEPDIPDGEFWYDIS